MDYDLAPSVKEFDSALKQVAPRLRAALPEHLNLEHFCATVLNCFRTDAKLQACSADSILDSVLTAAACGLAPLNGHSFLIPYNGRCSFVPGWKGLVHLVVESGKAIVSTNVALKGDHFVPHLGTVGQIEHIPLDPELEPAWLESNQLQVRPITYAYAVGRIRGFEASPIVECWNAAKLIRHRNKYNKQGTKHYSFREEEQYFRKVVLLQVIKLLPQSQQMANAIAANLAAETGAPVVIDGGVVHVDAGDYDTDDESGNEASQAPAPRPSPRAKSQQPVPAPQPSAAQQADRDTGEVPPPPAAPAAGPRVSKSGLAWLQFQIGKGALKEQQVLAEHGIAALQELPHESMMVLRRKMETRAAA